MQGSPVIPFLATFIFEFIPPPISKKAKSINK